MDLTELVALGTLLAQGIAKVVQAIQESQALSAEEKAKAIATIMAELDIDDAAVQAVPVRQPT